MESKVEESLEVIAKEIISQQSNSQGRPLVEVFKGDKVEKREDGIYIIRKVDFSKNPHYLPEAVFEFIKSGNLTS